MIRNLQCNKALSLVTLHYHLDSFILHDKLEDGGNKGLIHKINSNYKHYYDNVDELYKDEPMVSLMFYLGQNSWGYL